MNPDLFFDNFELLANAPNGIQKLRELILQLAVMGKLVEQNPNDEPASVLLEKIEAERAKTLKRSEINKNKTLSLDAAEMPFYLPETWEWVRIDKIARNVEYGTSEKASENEDGVPVLRMNNVQNGKIVYDDLKFVSESIKDLPRLFLKHNDLLFNRTNSYELVGKTGVFKGEDDTFTLASYLIRVSLFNEQIISDFINISLNSDYFRRTQIEPEITQQCGQANFNGTKLKNSLVPLPPLTEQKRIVAKVNELMALCDKLEDRRQKKQELQSKLNSAALERILSAENQEEFEQHWQRICQNFDLLYDNPENVEKLRQAILQLAVQGKLVEQNPEDEPASVLIEKVGAERKRSVKQGEPRKNRSLNAKEISDISYELPRGWEWVRFLDIGEFGRGKSKHRPRNDPILFNNGKYPLIQTGDVAKANGTIETYTNLYNEVGLFQSRMWPKGTLCITIAANIADSAILGFDACFPDSVVGFIPSSEIGSTRYFEYFMRTMKENLEHFAPSTAQKNINLGILENVLVPLPPKKELKRIIEKVDQLMGLCDELGARLRKEREDSEKLMEAVVKGLLESAVAGKSEKDERTLMQAAVIQLK